MRFKKHYRHVRAGLLVIGMLFVTYACQEQFGRLVPDQEHDDSVNVTYGDPKVLLVIVDGIRGQSIQEIEPPTINSLLNTAIHSWVSVSDEGTVEPGANWASMLTGVSKNKHGVLNDDFENANFDTYPLLFDRLKDVDSTIQSAMYTSSALFGAKFGESAAQSEVLSDDGTVTAAAVTTLGSSDELDVFTVHYTQPNTVGAAQGYDASVPAYRDAVIEFDNQLGELLTAMRSREHFATEKWLVIVTSSIGGDYPIADNQNDNTIFSRPLNNTFTIFNSPTYKTRYIGKPFAGNRYQGNFVRFDGQLFGTVSEGDNSVYNFGENSFAIELKVKKNKTISQIYPTLLSKRGEWNTETDSLGWTVFLEDNYWRFNARGTMGGGQVSGGELSDGTWNSIAIVGRIVNGERVITTYTNGVKNNEVNVKNWGAINNSQPLRIGYMGPNDWDPDVYIADVRIWKLALAEEVVNQYACEIGVDENHPYYDALAGFWPVTSYSDGRIEDLGPLGNDIILSNTGESSLHLNELICAPSSDDLAANVPRAVDVPLQIFTWLKVFAEENWQMDGRVWIDQ